MAPSTIGRGLKELAQDQPSERIRRPGAGRKPAILKDPSLLPDLEALVEPTTRGDPEESGGTLRGPLPSADPTEHGSPPPGC
jgi:hypothetical protein